MFVGIPFDLGDDRQIVGIGFVAPAGTDQDGAIIERIVRPDEIHDDVFEKRVARAERTATRLRKDMRDTPALAHAAAALERAALDIDREAKPVPSHSTISLINKATSSETGWI